MRFLVQPTPEALARARPPVRAFLAFAALGLVGLAVQRAAGGGFTPAGVLDWYSPGGEPLPAAALWEEVHAGAFVYGVTLLMLGSLLVVCPVSPRARAWLFWPAFAATLLDLAAPFAVVRLGGAGAGAVRVASTVAALGLLAVLLAVVAVGYGRAPAERGR